MSSKIEDTLDRRRQAMGREGVTARLTPEIADKVVATAVEALDATSVKVVQYQGELVKDEPRPDWESRLKASDLLGKWLDYNPSKIEHEVHGDVGITIIGLDQDKV